MVVPTFNESANVSALVEKTAHALEGVTVDQVHCETQDCLLDHVSCRGLLFLHVSKSSSLV